MRLEYDKEVDALYIRIQEKEVARTEEFEEGLNLDDLSALWDLSSTDALLNFTMHGTVPLREGP